MKKYRLILITAAAILIASPTRAFDWKPQTNEEIRSDMVTFAEGFAKEAKGTKAGRIVKKLVRQEKKLIRKDEKLAAKGLPQQYRFVWMQDTHDAVAALRAIYPPVQEEGGLLVPAANEPNGESATKATDKRTKITDAQIRRNTLKLLDYPLHFNNFAKDATDEGKEAFNTSLDSYLGTARQQAMEWLRTATVAPGELSIFKVYNMGFFIRTSERTFAIDIRWDGSDEDAKEIAANIDAMFLSHPHGDHYSTNIFKAVAEAGKQLILPSDVLPEYTGENKRIIGEDQPDGYDVAGIKVVSFMGNQGVGIPCNVYHMSFDGWTLVQNGDNSVAAAEYAIKSYPAADVVMAACWNTFQRILSIEAEAPGRAGKNLLFIPAHENEFHHGVDHRESYHEMFARKDRFANPDFNYPPFTLIANGESITLKH